MANHCTQRDPMFVRIITNLTNNNNYHHSPQPNIHTLLNLNQLQVPWSKLWYQWKSFYSIDYFLKPLNRGAHKERISFSLSSTKLPQKYRIWTHRETTGRYWIAVKSASFAAEYDLRYRPQAIPTPQAAVNPCNTSLPSQPSLLPT